MALDCETVRIFVISCEQSNATLGPVENRLNSLKTDLIFLCRHRANYKGLLFRSTRIVKQRFELWDPLSLYCSKANQHVHEFVPVSVTGATEAPCSRNCAFCVDGECTQCNQGFAHVRHTKRQNETRCVPCEMRNSKRKAAKFTVLDDSQCPGKMPTSS